MKYLFLLFLLVSTISHSQDSVLIKLDTVCASEDKLIKVLNEYKEIPMLKMVSKRMFGDKLQELSTVMFVNSTTQTYTLVEQISETLYCVIATGEQVKPYVK